MKLLLLLCLLPASLFAHTSHSSLGFTSGFTHPVFGPDHLLALLSVGILSVQIGGRAVWFVPLTFMAFMLVGGILGLLAFPLFSVEIAIALSVLLLGFAISLDAKLPLFLTMGAVGFFALFHGHTHGEEMPASAQPFACALGFLLGTALIHLLGVFLGLLTARHPLRTPAFRLSGAALALIGVYFLVQSLFFAEVSPALTSIHAP